jgi:hypothetical protein
MQRIASYNRVQFAQTGYRVEQQIDTQQQCEKEFLENLQNL